jgi:hypothetical protein
LDRREGQKHRGRPLKGLSLQNEGGQAKRKNTTSLKKIYFLIDLNIQNFNTSVQIR